MKKKKEQIIVPLPKQTDSTTLKDPVFHSDPLGSYTGRGDNPYEQPVQDADDL